MKRQTINKVIPFERFVPDGGPANPSNSSYMGAGGHEVSAGVMRTETSG